MNFETEVFPNNFRQLIKKGIFYGQADHKREEGGGVSHLGPDRKQMWKLWRIFFNGIWLYDTQNTFYLIVRGLKNAFLMPLTPLPYRYLTVLWQSTSGSKKELGILVVVKCSFFWRLPLPFLSNGHRGTLFSTLFFLSDGWKYNSAVCERAPLACFLTLPNWAESAQTDFNSFLILKHTLVV